MDFERDQDFADRKLSFLNHWVFGSGVAFGLGVQRIDSDSLLVEPGVAIDSQGRYLIVDEPTICRIRALDGFEAVRGGEGPAVAELSGGTTGPYVCCG